MREIKFRAWNLLTKKMMRHEDICYTPNLKMYELFCDTPDNRPWELMQYTGLKDKNGVEIYEGDILRLRQASSPNAYGVVKWDYNCFVLESQLATYKEYPYFIEREVIGNIYENKELLGDKNV